jgi:hypothetical protein
VSWTPGDGTASAFSVYRSDDRLPAGMHGWNRIAFVPAGVTEWVDAASLAPDRTYCYAIQAVNAAGGSPVSAGLEVRTPATLRPSVRRGGVRYAWGRARRVPDPGDVLRLHGTLLSDTQPAVVPDVRHDGFVLTTDDARQAVLLRVPPQDAGWRVGRGGALRWRDGAAWIDIDPVSGAFDLRVVRGSAALASLVGRGSNPPTFRLEVGQEAGSVTPVWRFVGNVGARTP